MSHENSIVGPDGELFKSFEAILAESTSAQELGEQFAISEQDRQRYMLAVMDKLERSNPEGLPPLYGAIGEDEDRTVVLAIPLLQIDRDDKKVDFYPSWRSVGIESYEVVRYKSVIDYLALCAKGFYMLRFDVYESETSLNNLQNPFEDKGSAAVTSILSIFSTELPQNKLTTRDFYRLKEREPGISVIEIDSTEWSEKFTDVHSLVKKRYQEAASQNYPKIEAARRILDMLGEEPVKPKRDGEHESRIRRLLRR